MKGILEDVEIQSATRRLPKNFQGLEGVGP